MKTVYNADNLPKPVLSKKNEEHTKEKKLRNRMKRLEMALVRVLAEADMAAQIGDPLDLKIAKDILSPLGITLNDAKELNVPADIEIDEEKIQEPFTD